MTAVLLFLKGVPLWVWAVIALVAGGLWYGSSRYDAGQADIQAKWDDQKALDAAATAKFNAETAKKDAAQAEALRQVGFQYERDKAHALDQKDAVIRDLRNGTLQLRKQWRCPAAKVSGTPDGPGIADAEADLQFTGAGDIVRIVGTCEAQVKGLQAVVEADRQ